MHELSTKKNSWKSDTERGSYAWLTIFACSALQLLCLVRLHPRFRGVARRVYVGLLIWFLEYIETQEFGCDSSYSAPGAHRKWVWRDAEN